MATVKSVNMSEFKVIFLGYWGVGKTSLLNRYISDSFSEKYRPTVGFILVPFSNSKNDQKIRVQFWDTAGQEAYESLIATFTRDCDICILVCDVTNENSFKKMKSSLETLWSNSPEARIFVVGNKVDMEERTVISVSDLELFISQSEKEHTNQIIGPFLTSAETGEGITELFSRVVDTLWTMHSPVEVHEIAVHSKPAGRESCAC